MLTILFYGCDKWYSVDYTIENHTESEIIIKYRYDSSDSIYQKNIAAYDKKILLTDPHLNKIGIDCSSKKDPEIKFLEIKEIAKVSGEIFKRELNSCDLWTIEDKKQNGENDLKSYYLSINSSDF